MDAALKDPLSSQEQISGAIVKTEHYVQHFGSQQNICNMPCLGRDVFLFLRGCFFGTASSF